MTVIELMANVLEGNLGMLTGTLADFSDADLLVRPVPAANHAAWQLGHLIKSEAGALGLINPALAPALPAGFADKFTKQTASIDDPSQFPKKAALIDTLTNVRSATVAWVKTLTPADLEKPSPERFRSWAPTLGHYVLMVPGHLAMHVGQLQVIRRKLGKPILF
ncbi:MAG TPA: DinB family protein [Tepidisphaeraceae bacterium]|nr:DinB family protein [Tepidisphaeraceae bacterium]